MVVLSRFSRIISTQRSNVLTVFTSVTLSIVIGLLPVIFSYVEGTASVQAASVDDLNAQKAALENQAKQAELQAQAQKSVAERAADKLNQVTSQISTLQSNIGSTQDQIASTQDQITQKNQEVDQLEADLRKVKDQQDVLIRKLYIMRVSMPDDMRLFSNEPISKVERDQAELQALKKSLSSFFDKTTQAKVAVESARSTLVKKNQDLQSLKVQQQEQQIGLADIKLEQAQLKNNAEAAVVSLEEQARQARIQEDKIKKQIDAAITAAINAKAAGKISGAGVGQRVTRGEIVGHEGSTGFSTGPHVHFEVRLNNTPVNPSPYVNNGTLIWPISSFVVSQGFGYTDYASSGAYGGSIHTGIDLAGPYGTPVAAPANGTVILNQYYGGYGNAWAEELDSGLVVLMGHMTGK